MNLVIWVEVVQAETDLDEHLPDEVVGERARMLFLDGRRQITVLAVLHYYIYARFCNERIDVANYKVRISLRKSLNFV